MEPETTPKYSSRVYDLPLMCSEGSEEFWMSNIEPTHIAKEKVSEQIPMNNSDSFRSWKYVYFIKDLFEKDVCVKICLDKDFYDLIECENGKPKRGRSFRVKRLTEEYDYILECFRELTVTEQLSLKFGI